MKKSLLRAYVVELLGTFAVVLFAAGVVCVNQLTLPENQDAGKTALFDHQPGLVGIALAQGLVLAVVLVLTMHVSGGYLNPAITIMLWVFNRMESVKAAWLIGAQIFGAVLAGLVLVLTFEVGKPIEERPSAVLSQSAEPAKTGSDRGVLRRARMGAPRLNPSVYEKTNWGSLTSGALIEFILTFFLVFAIFGTIRSKAQWRHLEEDGSADDPEEPQRSIDARLAALIAGGAMTAGVLFAFPLTGASANPARWFGPAFWEWAVLGAQSGGPSPFADMFVYIAGPIAAALVAGLLFFKLMPLSPAEKAAWREERIKKRALETHVTPKK